MILIFLIIILTFLPFLTNFNSSVEFAICTGISSGEASYRMETSLSICNINPLTTFCVVGNFSGGYSQADCNFNFNINVNITVDSYMNSSFNFSFSNLLKLERTTKIMAQFEAIPQCLLFSHYSFIQISETSVA